MDRVCDKCGKDFSGDGHWKQSLRRHQERKFPCDRERPQDAPRNPLRSLDSIEFPEGVDVPQGASMRCVTRWFFRRVTKDAANVCFIRPNMNKDEYWVRVSPGDVRIVKQWVFIQLWVNHVLVRLGPRGTSFEWDLQADTGIEMDRMDWDGIAPPDSEFIFEMKSVLKEFMDLCPTKVKIKNEIVKGSQSVSGST